MKHAYGSPPLTWGRLHDFSLPFLVLWFTPTHVGKTSIRDMRFRDLVVHPHSRGEDVVPGIFRGGESGSPPLTWGRRYHFLVDIRLCWFTPTHVGKTRARARLCLPAMVHPHSRGEDFTRQNRIFWCNGSPPRTWGRHFTVTKLTKRPWFTPTHVGKTRGLNSEYETSMVHPHARGEDS